MQITALVPIKTHSQRLPNKNFLDFNGHPLYSYVLKTLESIDHIDEIVVNTDSEEIEQFVKNSISKGRTIQRPNHLLGDHITMNSLIAHDLDHTDGELFLQTHVTNPLLSEKTIVKAIEQFTLNERIDSLLGVTPVKKRIYDQKLQPILFKQLSYVGFLQVRFNIQTIQTRRKRIYLGQRFRIHFIEFD